LQRQNGAWMVDWELITTVICETIECAGVSDIVHAESVASNIGDTIRDAIQSGSFASALQSNSNVMEILGSAALSCLVVWGTVYTTSQATDNEGHSIVNTNTTHPYYPDWKSYSGTCLNDGYEPTYMKSSPSYWLRDTLEGCCDAYYSGFNRPKCMNDQGSGKWYVDHTSTKCRTDCKEGGGSTCGGISAVSDDLIFTDPIDCCENELSWIFPNYCEAESLEIDYYCGTGKYYRGDEVCVKDCDTNCAGGDSTCGGIVKTSDVMLHDTATACCDAHFHWIEDELCAARSDGRTVDKYYPDYISKCIRDNETQAEDLSVPIYDTAEACCTAHIDWISLSECVGNARGVTAQGTGHY